MDVKQFEDKINILLKDKGKRNFVQSVEIIINTRGIDFKKPENRLRLSIPLPNGLGKPVKVAVFCDGAVAREAKEAKADLVILPDEVEGYKEERKLKDLVRNYILLAHPKLMPVVARHLGQYLGRRGKLPMPITGKVSEFVDRARRTVSIRTKGKYLPTLQTKIGTENMDAEKLSENAMAVYSAVSGKITEGNIRSVYIKLTMEKPIRVR